MTSASRNALSSAFTGPLLTDARYPEVLVAAATSKGEDLRLVLYPGGAGGRETLRIERLHPGRSYTVTGATEPGIVALPDGTAKLSVDLSGRTEVLIRPAS